MRGFQCYVSIFLKGNLTKCPINACWAMVGFFNENYWGQQIEPLFEKDIYIYSFSETETIEYQDLLLGLIDKITPCKIVTIADEKYIEFRMLKTYDQSLVLLNFIRNLWHEPCPNYTEKFFKALQKIHEENPKLDPLSKLTFANKEACTNYLLYPPGHSNVHNKDLLRIKTVEQLLNSCFLGTGTFLTGPN